MRFVNYRCSKCDIPLCSEKCELSDYHQLECDFLQNSTNLQMEHLTILRFLGMKSKNGKKFKDLMTLVSNQETKKKGLDWLKITQKATEIISNYPKIQASKEDIQEIICKIESNSYQLLSADQESLNGIYVQASMLNHTCFKANSRPSFGSNYQMKIMATQDIEINTEITTNYLEPFHTNLQRRAILLRGKSFECCCQRCSDPTEFQTFASCSRCQFCLKKNNGYFVSSNSLNLSSEWRCNGCFTMINGKEAMEFDNNLSIECQKINRNNLTNIEKFINVYSDLLSENHIFLLQLKMWMIEGLNRLPYKSQEEDVLIKKLKLIKQVLQGLQAFEAPYSYVNGILHLEKADTMLMKLQQMFSGNHENMVNYMDPFEMVQEAQKSVKIAEVTFKNEDAKSTDHCLKMKLCDLKIALSSFM